MHLTYLEHLLEFLFLKQSIGTKQVFEFGCSRLNGKIAHLRWAGLEHSLWMCKSFCDSFLDTVYSQYSLIGVD